VFQVARVEGLSMAPTLDDQDRLIVNKLIYRISSPRRQGPARSWRAHRRALGAGFAPPVDSRTAITKSDPSAT
jgi:signal peptidase I